MEIFIILCGSLGLPAVTIVTLVVLKRRITKRNQAERDKDRELIGTLEELVATKNDHIKRLQ